MVIVSTEGKKGREGEGDKSVTRGITSRVYNQEGKPQIETPTQRTDERRMVTDDLLNNFVD